MRFPILNKPEHLNLNVEKHIKNKANRIANAKRLPRGVSGMFSEWIESLPEPEKAKRGVRQ